MSPNATEGNEQELEGRKGEKGRSSPLEFVSLNSELLGHCDLGQREVATFKSSTK